MRSVPPPPLALTLLLACAVSPSSPSVDASNATPAAVRARAACSAAEALNVTGVSFGAAAGGAALGALLAAALGARGACARAVPAPAACGAPDSRACLRGVLRALAAGELAAAVLPAAAAPAGPRLRDAGLAELGALSGSQRRACLAAPPARSLPDLADPAVAAHYADPGEESWNETNACAEPCAVLYTDTAAEAELLRGVVARHGLRARVRLGTPPVGRDAVLCTRAPPARLQTGTRVLAPPACLEPDCPFEARRLIKLANARTLARAPAALRELAHLELSEPALRALEERGARGEPAAAARDALAALGGAAAFEARVAVMVPAGSRRLAGAADALRAAAELAERDEAEPGLSERDEAEPGLAERNDAAPVLAFKAELVADACSARRAFAHLTAALGGEFGSLSAVAGPACGAAWADVARQSAGLALPVLAYTAQAPVEGARALLAAGDARREALAVGALLARLGWRRVAVLSELGTRAALDPARLGADVVVHVELPDGDESALVRRWAERAAGADARVLYVAVEGARAARAALCAGRRAGLSRGTAWLVAGVLAPGWLRRRADDAHDCSQAELERTAEGHLSAAPPWTARWRPPRAWAERWRAACARGGGEGECSAPPPAAGLLYDALRLWAAALRRLLALRPTAFDDLHQDETIEWLISDASRAPYAGVTGDFQWEDSAGARARSGPLLWRQWRGGRALPVGNWSAAAGLALDEAALHWDTPDGRAPRDADDCALRALAAALHSDCRAAHAAAAALPLAALAMVLASGAWRWRRRARRERRARLAALDMRELGPSPRTPDRWELPRERVVINRKLGAGAFGAVYGGHALACERRGWEPAAVKTLKAGASAEDKLDFLAEAEALKRFEHENVVRLLGVVTATEPACIVMEFAAHGDLKGYLAARRRVARAGGAAGAGAAPARLTRMARDAARALAYLARRRYVHRDVAARNCLVTAGLRVKLADFGMARLVFERDYYRFERRGMLPVRWMAPESLARGVFSPASDVWAFGVLLYEIVTFGAPPFRGLSNEQVLERVRGGRALDPPPGAGAQLRALLARCWRVERRARPGAAQLAAELGAAPRLLTPCLDEWPDEFSPEEEPDVTRDALQARWASWAALPSAGTDCTYLSAEAAPADTDAFLPPAPPR